MIDQEEIHNQCHSEDPKERMRALEELKSFFSYIPDKLKAWNDLVKLANNEDRELRDYTAEALGSAFFIFQINKKHGMIYID